MTPVGEAGTIALVRIDDLDLDCEDDLDSSCSTIGEGFAVLRGICCG